MTIAPTRIREPTPPPEPGVARAAHRPVIVTGILVIHDGGPWLNECLDALVLQTRAPDRLVVVDTGSTDDSLKIVSEHRRIREVIDELEVISAPAGSTFGEAVGRAVEQLSTRAGSHLPRTAEWLWLLHDDSAAAPEALAHLLDAARRSPSVGVAGPKLTTWDDPSRLLEVGQHITRSGHRAGGPVRGEPDQGQHDLRTDVLGVNTSGMLIRREVFDALGGFDPAFGQFRDDLDLSWRAHLAGHRVVVVPKARMREAAASATGQRSPGQSAGAARRRDRRAGRQVALARCSLCAAPFLTLWIALASLGSAAILLVVKRPHDAWDELGNLGALMTPWRPVAARWRSRGTRRVQRRDLRGLFATPRAGFRQTLDRIQDTVALGAGGAADQQLSSAQLLETGPVSDDSESLEVSTLGVTSRIMRHPGFLAVLVGALLAVATWRPLLGGLISTNGYGFAGGELLPVSTDASGLWHAWLDGWHGSGLGSALEAAPYLPVLAAGAWVVEHLPFITAPTSSVSASIAWLLAAAIPMSAWTAYLAARVATRAPWPRAWAALAWASLATLTTAQASGRLGAVVGHILLPLLVAGFVCAARRFTSVPLTFGAALALAVAGAFNPPLAALGALAALVLLVVGNRAIRLRAAVLLLVPAGLLGPWILQLFDRPVLLLAGPGLTQWQGSAPEPWELALLHPGGPGSYPVLLSAPIVLAGVVAMVRRGSASRAMSLLAVLTVLGLALGVMSPHISIGRIPGDLARAELAGAGAPITVWAGTGLDLAALALIAAAVLGLDGLAGRLSRSGFGWRQLLVAPIVMAAVMGVVVSIVTAGWLGVGETLTSATPKVPAVAADQAEGPMGNRLLELTINAGTIGYRVVGSEPGAVVRDLPGVHNPPDRSLAAAVRSAVHDGGESSADGARDALADQGIGFVALRGAPTEPLVRRLDATAGMTRLSDSQGLVLWRVLPRDSRVSSSRLRLEDALGVPLRSIAVTGDHGQTDVMVGAASLSPGTSAGAKAAAAKSAASTSAAVTAGVAARGRRLVVAEPVAWADHARVTFAGRELALIAGGDQPAYDLPSSAGRLTITLAPSQQWWRWWQLGLLLVGLFLAAPFGSSGARRTS